MDVDILPKEGVVTVTHAAKWQNLAVTKEDVDITHLRKPAPLDSHIKDPSSLKRLDALEVNLGDGKFLCAVFVARVKASQGNRQQKKSIDQALQHLHAIADHPFEGKRCSESCTVLSSMCSRRQSALVLVGLGCLCIMV